MAHPVRMSLQAYTTLHAIHQKWIWPAEHATLADRRDQSKVGLWAGQGCTTHRKTKDCSSIGRLSRTLKPSTRRPTCTLTCWLVPNNMNLRLVLSLSQLVFHLMDYGSKPECQVNIGEAILKVRKVKVSPPEQLHLEKVLTVWGAKYPLVHMVMHHFTLALGASMVDVDALFSGQIPTKEQQILRRGLSKESLPLSQPEIRQASAHNHHTNSVCPVW